jgi:hypothetical protein
MWAFTKCVAHRFQKQDIPDRSYDCSATTRNRSMLVIAPGARKGTTTKKHVVVESMKRTFGSRANQPEGCSAGYSAAGEKDHAIRR